MLYTSYHNGQQQAGKFKENIRFLSAAIPNLLVDYLTWVISLRQISLLQSAPHAVIFPYLWCKNGKVRADNRLTQFMKQS